jgi:FixJ family two-component response regulator
MPGASGPELVRQLVERRPALKVIYMSGYTDEAIVHHGVLDPGIVFLHKPFSAESLGQRSVRCSSGRPFGLEQRRDSLARPRSNLWQES